MTAAGAVEVALSYAAQSPAPLEPLEGQAHPTPRPFCDGRES